MRVVFLGNHTVGVRSLSVLADCAEVVAVVAHPPDPEEGVRYASVYDEAVNRGLNVVRMRPRDACFTQQIIAAKPDLILTADYRYLLPIEVAESARVAAVNLHPSLLPKYRGRAPLNWAILQGETEFGLTAHWIDAGVDGGEIIAQERFQLSADEDVGDALEKLYPLYDSLTRHVVRLAKDDALPSIPQDHDVATCFPRRRPEDGLIDWNQPAACVHRLIRAVAAPYPGAFGYLAGRKVTIWRAVVEDDGLYNHPGCVTACGTDSGYRITCGEGAIRAVRWDVDGVPDAPLPLDKGACFEIAPSLMTYV